MNTSVSITSNFESPNYISYLKAVCSLSKLFSESNVPYLYYRAAENIFCKAFSAENLSRDDLAYDARLGTIGIGLKTFIDKKNNNEKIAEFNTHSLKLRSLKGEELAKELAKLRNERIEFANRNYNIKNSIYHCIARNENSLKIFNTDYDFIDIENLKNIIIKDTGISFNDRKNDYSFNFSKSTLYKKFKTPENAVKIDIEIIEDPFELLLNLLTEKNLIFEKFVIPGVDFVVLPLYSLRDSKPDFKVVSPKSGLNQWHAGGRKRDFGEVYIPVPKEIHKRFPRFFPDRDTSFTLIVPSGEKLSAKLCQENSKALMTNPNNALSDWMLRKVLKLEEGRILTYKRLMFLGIDSVRITKIDDQNYKIDFAKINSYEDFIYQENGFE